jgi:hypothetical protein
MYVLTTITIRASLATDPVIDVFVRIIIILVYFQINNVAHNMQNLPTQTIN